MCCNLAHPPAFLDAHSSHLYCSRMAFLTDDDEICGEVTIAHTSREISPFSITSFYEVGLGLGLICEKDMVPYYD